MEDFKAKIDADYTERIAMVEALNERQAQAKLDDLRKEFEREIEKLRKQSAIDEQELKEAIEESNKLRKKLSELNKSNSALINELTSLKTEPSKFKTNVSQSGFDSELKLEEENDDVNMMEFDDESNILNNMNETHNAKVNQSIQIQTSFHHHFMNESIQTESIKKKSIGIDVKILKKSIKKL